MGKVSTSRLVSQLFVAIVLPQLLFATVRTWDGTGGDNNASTPGNWGGTAPVAGDDIVLNAGTDKNMTWDLDISIASWTQVGYVGTVTVATVYGPGGFTTLNIAGNCVVSNGVWTHTSNTTAEAYRLAVSVGGNMSVGPNGALDVTGCGYREKFGPGKGYSGYYGSSHGGSGGGDSGPCYDSVIAPANIGSGGYNAGGGNNGSGGGAVFLDVSGRMHNDGLVAADGNGSGYGAGAGGSVYVVAGEITGGGNIHAAGGLAGVNGAGGGGRVAVVLTSGGADFSGYSGTFSAYGGSPDGSAGTVYLEKETDASGEGELIVNNLGGVIGHGAYNTDLNGIDPVSYKFSRVTLVNNANLCVGSDDSLDIEDAVISADGIGSGMWIDGGTLLVPAAFAYSNMFVGISSAGSVFSPAVSMTIRTNAEFRIDSPHVMTSAVVVAAGGLVSHSTNNLAELYAVNLTVDGSLTVCSGGNIDVTGCGYRQGKGPGSAGGPGYYGGSYGGYGGNGGPCYGSIVAPTNIGSGGYQAGIAGNGNGSGGGSIVIDVSGEIVNDGLICADGNPAGYGSGSGGTVFLTCADISGGGVIRADGGPYIQGVHAAGGGRISLVAVSNGACFAGFSGTISAYGGCNGAGAGTIYRQSGGVPSGLGAVTVDNGVITGGYTDVPPASYYTSGEVDRAAFFVRNNATLRLTGDFTVGDILLPTADATLDLNFNTLYVNCLGHSLDPGSVINYGEIIWLQGTVISFW